MAPKTRAKPGSKASDAPPKASGATTKASGAPPKASGAPQKASGAPMKSSGAAQKASGSLPKAASARPKTHSGNGRAADARLDAHGLSGGGRAEARAAGTDHPGSETRAKLQTKDYDRELARMYVELVKLQEWIRATGRKLVILFEGRDAAGKGGVIKRITEPLNPRYCRVAALPAPTDREKTQWYFQRYVAHLPSAGEIVLFDRSWYNRAGVERVMGFCTEDEYREFLRSVPEFERMLQRSGIDLVKYWFSVSDAEQERRFQDRIADPTKRWKLSPMDVESRARWVEYSKAKDEMFAHTDTKQSPWWVVPSDDKKRARLNTIAHLLSLFPYEDLTPEPISLPPRHDEGAYVRPPMSDQTFVPQVY